MQTFTDGERREFIDDHIAYRLTVLLSAVRRREQNATFFDGRGDVYRASIEGAFIMLRVFIEFLGVESSRAGGSLHLVQRTRQKGKKQKQVKDTDVMLDCFGLPLLSPSDFGSTETLIARVHDGLSKSTAHFTYRTNHFFQADTDFPDAVKVILQLLQDRFFGPLKETLKCHPDLP